MGGDKVSPPTSLEGFMRLLLLLIFLLLTLVNPALAGRVITECPLTKPGKPDLILVHYQEMPDGTPYSRHPPDKIIKKNGLQYLIKNYSEENEKNSSILCFYSDYTDIILSIPGKLLSCTSVIREISSRDLIIDEYIRVWCESEVEK
jgi:hypothetical protein